MPKSEESLESKETPPTEVVGDEELDSAAQMTEEVVEKKEVSAKEPPEESEEHKERSRLGRKVRQLEDIIQQQNVRMEMLMAKLEKPVVPEYPAEDELSEEDYRKMLAYERKKSQEQQNYSRGYLQSFYVEGRKDREANPELYGEVFEEMKNNFNVRYSNDPSMDAALNYAKAKAAVFAKKTASSKPKPNVRGEKPQASTSLDVKSRAEAEPSEEFDLDEESREFVKKVNMKKDSIKEALKGEAPAHLRR